MTAGLAAKATTAQPGAIMTYTAVLKDGADPPEVEQTCSYARAYPGMACRAPGPAAHRQWLHSAGSAPTWPGTLSFSFSCTIWLSLLLLKRMTVIVNFKRTCVSENKMTHTCV